MALKKNEQLLLDSILQTANIVKGLVGNDIDKISEHIVTMLNGFYEESKKRVILEISEDGEITAKIADFKSDFVRTRFNTDQSMLSLKGKINGVPIDVKVVKDDVSFSNKEVAASLMELSLIVAGMPVVMRDHGQDDWPRDVGGIPKTLSGLEGDLKLDEDDSEEEFASQDNLGDEDLSSETADKAEDTEAREKTTRRIPVSVMQDSDD